MKPVGKSNSNSSWPSAFRQGSVSTIPCNLSREERNLNPLRRLAIWYFSSSAYLHSLASFPQPGMDLEQLANQTKQWISEQPVEQIYIAVAVLFITFAFFLILSFLRTSKSNTIVLAGLSGSGKTILFYQLRDGSPHQGTVTSMEPNDDTFVLHSDLSEEKQKKRAVPVHLIDVPGHPRLKPKLDDYLPQAAGLVFTVDAQDFLYNYQAAAEYLYDILTKAIVAKKKIPVLILCNKTDKVTAHSKEFIKKQLEKEIDKLRASRNAISTADVTNEVVLGTPGTPFSFSQCQNKVTEAEASGLTGNISQVEQFIKENIRR
ncbi:Signal recognition particle receptor subunit beta [Rhynchospora pubera]|uniref:Signal recognition particle receptor subunit beta n=1 Tax=Rhynchospora pubera TaxID=906938 RepID=A0AAV8F4H4_9POAL|nr:Signal recognition particle receptor subunit beta [Rhynchospora pubera]